MQICVNREEAIVALNVRVLRLMKNIPLREMTQELVARGVATSRSQLSKVENLEQAFRPQEVVALAEVLGVTVDDLTTPQPYVDYDKRIAARLGVKPVA